MSAPSDRIEIHKGGGFSCVGHDAVHLYRAVTLKQALSMYARSKMLMARNITPTSMLAMATSYTCKAYKRGQHQQAATDLQVWIDTMKAALPVVREGVPE